MTIYLDESKKYYKANLHCHTTLSDGSATPEQIKDEYTKRGYSVVAFTDHEHIVDNSYLTDDSFLAITGAELGIPSIEGGWKNNNDKQYSSTIHTCVYSFDPHNVVTPYSSRARDNFGPTEVRDASTYDNQREKRIYSAEGVNDFVRYVHEQGFLIALNHPSWSLINAKDYLEFDGFDFIELYNTGCIKMGHPKDEITYNDIIKSRKRIFCTACDDNHNRRGFTDPRSDSFGGWVMINADSLDYSVIMNALKNGDFYASEGPEIYSLTREENKVTIKTSPVKKMFKLSDGRGASGKIAAEGEYITEATFEVDASLGMFRIRIEDEHGCCAYTQAYVV